MTNGYSGSCNEQAIVQHSAPSICESGRSIPRRSRGTLHGEADVTLLLLNRTEGATFYGRAYPLPAEAGRARRRLLLASECEVCEAKSNQRNHD
jgi:hypothetical protein